MSRELKNWGMLLFLATIWGSSFILMKRGMIDKVSGDSIFSSNQVGAMRMLFASSALLPLGLRHFKSFNSVKFILSLAVVAFLGNFVPAFLFTYAETGISSGYAGMLNSCTPIFTLIIGTLLFKQPLVRVQVLGVAIGTVGIVWLVNGVSVVDTSGSVWHVLAVVLATLFYAISVNTIKYNLNGIKPLKITSMAFTLSFIPALILFFHFDTPATIVSNSYAPSALIYIGILALIGTAFSVVIFNILIANSSALFASSVTYFIPIVALLIGLWDGEVMSIYQALAMLVILSGVYIANVLGNRKEKKDQRN
ncbi:MAG: DMT family transporter [Crocinitomicaceae bacterium]|nr:DMT family transporter [Crocinitomicaceae bacterium]